MYTYTRLYESIVSHHSQLSTSTIDISVTWYILIVLKVESEIE